MINFIYWIIKCKKAIFVTLVTQSFGIFRLYVYQVDFAEKEKNLIESYKINNANTSNDKETKT